MENLTCKGLSAAHRRMLIKCITEEIGSIPEPVRRLCAGRGHQHHPGAGQTNAV